MIRIIHEPALWDSPLMRFHAYCWFKDFRGNGMAWLEEKDDCVVLNVRVVPRASKDGIAGVMGGETLKVRIQAPPVEGKANAYLVKFLSKHWKIPRSSIEILSGETGRNKRLRISSPPDELLTTLRLISNI